MARTESLGGGYSTPTGTSPGLSPGPVGGTWSWQDLYEKQTKVWQTAFPTVLDMYNIQTGQKPANGVYEIQKIAQKANEQYLVNAYGPDDPRRPKPLDWERVTELLLDMFGYGAAIASFVPNPATRIGGQLGANLSRAARAFNRGNVEGGVTALVNGSRNLYQQVGRHKKSRQTDQAHDRNR